LVRLDVATVVHRHARRAQTGELPTELAKTWKVGPELAPSVRAPAVEIGAELFRRAGDRRLSLDGGLACASCHPDGRADGLTWRRGDKQAVVHEKCFTFSSGGGKAERVPCRDFDFTRVQTPILAGRVRDTAPYKWSGRDDTLHESIRKTVSVLDGQPKRLHRWEVAALARYVRSLAPPRPPTVVDVDAVARGRALFESDRLGCAGCHAGPRFTDRDQHDLASLETDTPSLLGAAHSAPYLHGGAADSLSELLTDAGLDMADVSDLSDAERDDLIHFLRSL
jgi:cytochrome c peroxidase